MTNDELRIEIAKAKGWTKVRWDEGGSRDRDRDGTRYYWLRGKKLDGPHDADEVPNWPESIADAWGLVEEMRKRGLYLLMNDTMSQYRAVFFTQADTHDWANFSTTTSLRWGFANSPAAAICLAWLSANQTKSK